MLRIFLVLITMLTVGVPAWSAQYIVCNANGRAELWEDVYWADGTKDGVKVRAAYGACALGPWWVQLDVDVRPAAGPTGASPRGVLPRLSGEDVRVATPQTATSLPPGRLEGAGSVAQPGNPGQEVRPARVPSSGEITALLQRVPAENKPVEPDASHWQVEAELLKQIRSGTLPTVRIDGGALPAHMRAVIMNSSPSQGASEKLGEQLKVAIADLRAVSNDMEAFAQRLADPAFASVVCPAKATGTPTSFKTAGTTSPMPATALDPVRATQLAQSTTRNSMVQASAQGPDRGLFCWYRNGVRHCLIYRDC